MMITLYSDAQLVHMIQLASTKREMALNFVYTQWSSRAKAILIASGANITDAEDAVQEALIVFDGHIRNNKYERSGTMKNYFIGICKGRLNANRRKTERIVLTNDHRKMDRTELTQPEMLLLNKEKKRILMNMLDMMDEKCQEILRLYKLSYSMAEIADIANLGNANNARQRVYYCRGKLKKIVSKSAWFMDYFNSKL